MVVQLFTVGHGTLTADQFARLLVEARIALLVDVRAYPGSRRHPHFSRDEMARWLPEAGVAYRWEPALGGRRNPTHDSVNVALRQSAFRGYADYMATGDFAPALERLLQEASEQPVAAMCAETLWWHCHRLLLADAAALLHEADVMHLDHRGRQQRHTPTEEARVEAGRLVYDVGENRRLPGL